MDSLKLKKDKVKALILGAFSFPQSPGTKKRINAQTFDLFTVEWLTVTLIGFILTLCWPQTNCIRKNIFNCARTVVDGLID
jgi:hypothetical protein